VFRLLHTRFIQWVKLSGCVCLINFSRILLRINIEEFNEILDPTAFVRYVWYNTNQSGFPSLTINSKLSATSVKKTNCIIREIRIESYVMCINVILRRFINVLI